ncbi:DNA polymerase III subunit delta [Limnothrix sp. FACHB-881]|uniref:DNA polymerase III subunit delta n=1 Tax=unclassified Limnothrix TaxID=2632864 RepID=UPI0016829C05|nr:MULTISPECIES: DNA polymerase III subunit delta [unclassified Limnothrix]MBD2552709.1 DNA polymerase III subunit delta [Limnothrix sp. FACHB-708]MBD2589979.1 DNA polymerase III subunit delta [Limnothrix sp. FACHB-406]MBD2637207.1 DNA polymerase III subunit delta [Limnothrix sp. FACHB-881]
MPVYWFWGEDDFAMQRAIDPLRSRVDAAWESFNFEKIPPDREDGLLAALAQAVTPPFGAGDRLVWLAETALAQRCPDDWLRELERTLPQIPDNAILLLTSRQKPDGRLKSTKLLQKAKNTEIQEFSPIPPWKTEELLQQVKRAAQAMKVKIKPEAAELLVNAVGNNTRQLYSELEKLQLFVGDRPIAKEDIHHLVSVSTQSSLELAKAISLGQISQALKLIADLIARNENPLRIHASLVTQFRLWLWVKLMLDRGERDDLVIAKAADLGNPKRLFFIKKEVQPMGLKALQKSLQLLLEQETLLKRGSDPIETLQSKAIELCLLFQKN